MTALTDEYLKSVLASDLRKVMRNGVGKTHKPEIREELTKELRKLGVTQEEVEWCLDNEGEQLPRFKRAGDQKINEGKKGKEQDTGVQNPPYNPGNNMLAGPSANRPFYQNAAGEASAPPNLFTAGLMSTTQPQTPETVAPSNNPTPVTESGSADNNFNFDPFDFSTFHITRSKPKLPSHNPSNPHNLTSPYGFNPYAVDHALMQRGRFIYEQGGGNETSHGSFGVDPYTHTSGFGGYTPTPATAQASTAAHNLMFPTGLHSTAPPLQRITFEEWDAVCDKSREAWKSYKVLLIRKGMEITDEFEMRHPLYKAWVALCEEGDARLRDQEQMLRQYG